MLSIERPIGTKGSIDGRTAGIRGLEANGSKEAYIIRYAGWKVYILKDNSADSGQRKIYEDLLDRLANADIADSAEHLDLLLNDAGEAEAPFFGTTYLVSREGVRRSDGQRFPYAAGSVMIHYILKGCRSRAEGKFVTFEELPGPLFKQGSYSQGALESPIIKRFQGRLTELLAAASLVGGRLGGEAGLGAMSLIFDLLPHIPLQLIFYDRDDEFPARVTLLFDHNATQMIDFEVLAVLVTLLVQSLTKPWGQR